MVGIFSRLIDFMEEGDWKYEILEDEHAIRFHVKVSSGRLLCYAEADETKQWLTFYSYLPVNAPADKHEEMSEFVVRANRGLRIGNFEVDLEDGEIRFKTSIDIEGGTLVHTMIDNLLRANLTTMNRYFTGMMKLIYSDQSAIELIEEIEGPRRKLPEIDDDEDEFLTEPDEAETEADEDDAPDEEKA